jgi:hypothetical protein
MKRLLIVAATLLLTSCASEQYSSGERIGYITQFSKSGIIWKSHEGHLNVTQTGMNTGASFDFSIDNDHEDPAIVNALLLAADKGSKVKLHYHETFNKNWFDNRGETDHFVDKVEVLTTNPLSPPTATQATGAHDTIYVVIDRRVRGK